MRTGRLRRAWHRQPEALAAATRVPTVAKPDCPASTSTSWYGSSRAPAHRPAITASCNMTAPMPGRNRRCATELAGLGLEPVGNTPEAFAAMITRRRRKRGDIVRKAGIKIE